MLDPNAAQAAEPLIDLRMPASAVGACIAGLAKLPWEVSNQVILYLQEATRQQLVANARAAQATASQAAAGDGNEGSTPD